MEKPLKNKLECALNSKRNVRKSREESREIIIGAAAELFSFQGYTETTTKQIAERAGVLNSTLYNSFSSKEEILKEIIARGYSKALEKVRCMVDKDDFIVGLSIPVGLCLHVAHTNPRDAEVMMSAFQSWTVMESLIQETVGWVEHYYRKFGLTADRIAITDNIVAVIGSISYYLMRAYQAPDAGNERDEIRICIEIFCALFGVPAKGIDDAVERMSEVFDQEIEEFKLYSVSACSD